MADDADDGILRQCGFKEDRLILLGPPWKSGTLRDVTWLYRDFVELVYCNLDRIY